MSRRRRAVKRSIDPDSKYNSLEVAKFINMLMLKGKKSIAERIFYGALELAAQRVGETDAVKVFNQCLNNVKPVLEVKSRRVGGATYQVPVEVSSARQFALASRWLINYSRQRKGQAMIECLAAEIADAFKNQGSAIKKREDTHKMAEANKAFAHYKW
ncbi:MAG: 30S ribosomal protein S7 [Candidatus Auribacterota bacterium]|jgi:small subunit ribosomal protein S7|nr:30S ribosomal protein S7 [Candidatus Auribacterota bacterium]